MSGGDIDRRGYVLEEAKLILQGETLLPVTTKTKSDSDRALGGAQVPVVRRKYIGEGVIGLTNTFIGAQPGQERDDNGLKMRFCWCPPGTFTMGSPADAGSASARTAGSACRGRYGPGYRYHLVGFRVAAVPLGH
jgi:formylglycine-generating enzyme required for sulfatase activity